MIRRSLSLWTVALTACALAGCPGNAPVDSDATVDALPDTVTADSADVRDVHVPPDVREAGREASVDVVDDSLDVMDSAPDATPDAPAEAGDVTMTDVRDATPVDVATDTGLREMDCANGVDDDGDGTTDCADRDCAGISFCESPESSCGDGRDNDADGRTDCADTDCSTTLACTHPCGSGTVPVLSTGTRLPAAITDLNTTTSRLNVSAPGIVVSAAVAVDITHTDTFDLTLSLQSPSGTSVTLSARHGGGSLENFTGTVFTDSASQTVSGNDNPFTGDFQPEEPLSGLASETAAGTWVFSVEDGSSGDEGTLNTVQLLLCVCDHCEIGTACSDGMDNDGDGNTDCADNGCAGTAGCESPEMTCNDGRDNDGDGNTDCADSDCNTRSNCEFGTERSCTDRIDNDGDGNTDCTDSDCATGALCQPESDCGDRVDNDLDGATDCGDPGCAGINGCEYRVERSCNDRRDNDGDGAFDCADSDCVDSPECLAGCPTGTSATVFRASDDPQSIPDLGNATSRVTVPQLGLIVGLAARVTVNHTRDSDLTLSLTSPSNTRANLSVRHGGSGDNYTATVFTDSATNPVAMGRAPFTGQYRPDQPLSQFIGELASGQWRFTAADGNSGTTGTIQSFELIACVCQGTDGCEVGAACANTVDDDGDGLADCADPDCNGVGFCESNREVSCTDGNDNDGDGLIDCTDPDCDGVSGCETGSERTCDDKRDNDQDGATDCADSDCATGALCGPESDCGNGIDDDADGKTDCADVGCNGMAGCTFAGESACSDGIDNDGDGNTDCTDADCQALDLCTAGCPVGTHQVTYNATDLPAAIRDNLTTTSSISVSDVGHVAGAAVRINITHTNDHDLNIDLVSPSNTTDSLLIRSSTDANHASGQNFNNTLFIDSATTAIGSGRGPYAGSYRPDQPLSSLNGQVTNGVWKLKVRDVAAIDTGTLNSFTLYLCVGP